MAERKVNCIPATVNIKAGTAGMKPRLRKVAGYARVSTDSDEQFTSYEAQIDYYTKKIKANPGWEFVKVYSDEGITGTNTKHREGFNEMIRDAMEGKIDLIVTKSVSRFARNTVDSLTTIRALKEKNVECYFEKENIYTFDGKGELLITIMSSMAQEESRSISENVTWGKRKCFADGKVPMQYKRSLGYKKGMGGAPEIVEEEAKTVRRIYDLYLAGSSTIEIKRILENEGVATPMGKSNWNTVTIINILQNERYKGAALLQKTYTVDFLTKKTKWNTGEVPQYYVENNHPGIVDPNTWAMVQMEHARRCKLGDAFRAESNIFTARLVCGECGGYYSRETWESAKEGKIVVWRCHHKYASERKTGEGNSCESPIIKEQDVINRFLEALNSVIDDKETVVGDCIKRHEDYSNNQELEKQIAECMTKCRELSEKVAEWAEKNTEKYRECARKLDKENEKNTELNVTLQERKNKAEMAKAFMREIQKHDGHVSEFTTRLWNATIDTAIVQHDGSILFRFKDGKEIVK